VELVRLQKIQALKELGLSLEEIGTVIPLYCEDPTGLTSKRKVLEILKFHLRETDEKLNALNRFRSELKANIDLIQEWIEKRSGDG
jgi:DNA-binding transcriptional MerR regulator